MTSNTAHSPLVFAFGILGNIVSFLVFLAPLPTFYRVYQKKSTERFQSIPYISALFSASIWIYYASLKSDEMLLITVNGFGCVVEAIYIAMFIKYAPKKSRVSTLRLLILVNFGGFCMILLLSHFLAQGPTRVKIIGWVCVVFSVSVFAAPLSIMRLVIRTKSVEFMPFSLSFFLTLSAIMWLFYGLLLKDLYVAAPNMVGVSFGVVQMILYAIYRNKNKTVIVDEEKQQQLPEEHKVADDNVKQNDITILPTSDVPLQVINNDDDNAVSPSQSSNENNADDNEGDDDEKNGRDFCEFVPKPCHVDARGSDLIPNQVPVVCSVRIRVFDHTTVACDRSLYVT